MGTSLGGEDLFNGAISGATVVSNVPLNGETLYITLWSEINGQLQKQQYTLRKINLNYDTDTDKNTDAEQTKKPKVLIVGMDGVQFEQIALTPNS